MKQERPLEFMLNLRRSKITAFKKLYSLKFRSESKHCIVTRVLRLFCFHSTLQSIRLLWAVEVRASTQINMYLRDEQSRKYNSIF